MFPAIWSNRHAVALILVIGILLTLPMLMSVAGLPPRDRVYSGIRVETGTGPLDEQNIFEEKGPVDILFVGSSLIVRGVDMNYVQQQLSASLGRPAKVARLSLKWQGLDMQYMLMRDFLEHRKANLVIMDMPTLALIGDAPHIQAYRWMRWGEFPESTSGLSFRQRMAIYGAQVLGAPRQMVNYLRPNRLVQSPRLVAKLGSQSEYGSVGYFGGPFVTEPRTPPQIPVDSMSSHGVADNNFDFQGLALGPYHRHWAREIGNLAKQYNVPFAMIHVPEDTERGMSQIPERMYWPEIVGLPAAPVLGIPSATLFQATPASEINNYYYDQHFNDNGKEFFTRAITPAVLDLYMKETHGRTIQ
ncbi:hypothetical protein [Edaphobacter modestus]|uniref:Uncharacterized protein n=1 Tax=Edaphobacter modestus TaxID=388466 RepID=A0A4Q7YWZ8_9BACT|nr:hypothetical protein [Edaphobacter modestus]RZU42462.1 hypothetical protein BDD14_4047 [Edaphobacter modestus]